MRKERWQRLLARVKESGVSGIALVPGPNLYYLTGLRMGQSERVTVLVAKSDGKAFFVMPGFEASKGEAAVEALREEGVPVDFSVYPYLDQEGPLKAFLDALGTGASSRDTWAFEYGHMRLLEFRLFKEALGDFRHVDAGDILKDLRMIKDEEELSLMEKACKLCDLGVDVARGLCQPGRTGKEIARGVEAVLRDKGAGQVGISVATGPETAIPHARTSDRKIAGGDLVWIDLTVNVDGYWGDITRTFAVGTISRELEKVYRVVLEAQEHARLKARPGMTGKEIDDLAREVIGSYGYGEYFTHRTGHGLGLEVHEEPYIVASNTEVLREGTTFTVEPGIYIPGKGGVRIEDDVVLTANGARSLTSYPRNLLYCDGKLVV